MTNAEIAAKIAQALGLPHSPEAECWWEPGCAGFGVMLLADGSNIFRDPWFRLCLLELGKRGRVSFGYAAKGCIERHEFEGVGWPSFDLSCPAAEFPARALAKLMAEKCF